MTLSASPFAQAHADLTPLGLNLIPCLPPNVSHAGRGKCPGEYAGGGWRAMVRWTEFIDSPASGFRLGSFLQWPEANAGALLGTPAGIDEAGNPQVVVALDFDAEDGDALDLLLRNAPASPMVKVGRRGETRFFKASTELKSASFDGPEGRLLDLLCAGRQTIVPPSVHATTMATYRWTAGPVPVDELPILTGDALDQLKEALELCGWPRQSPTPPRAAAPTSAFHDGDPFSVAKAAALNNLDKWVPTLPNLYGLRPARGGYEAVDMTRGSSGGRSLHERKRNLSIQASGVKDFGTGWTGSAIDLVMRLCDLDQAGALDWLEERLGIGTDEGVVIDFGTIKAAAVPGAAPTLTSASATPAAPWARPFRWIEPSEIPPREWLYNRHLIRGFLSATFSPGGVGKSSLKLAEAMAMASGRPLLGVKPAQRLRVAYWNGEDPFEETQRRAMAIAMHYGLTAADLEGWLFLGSGREAEVVIAQQKASGGATVMAPAADALTQDIKAKVLDVVIVDPFVSSHRVTENDNGAIDLVAKTWNRIAGETGVAIELVHHTRKTGGAETTAEDGRGASSLLAAVRSAQVLNMMSKDEATRAGIDNRFAYFRADNGKANLAPRSDGASWYRFVGVDLGNSSREHESDTVGVVTRWSWPDAFEGLSGADLLAVQKRIDEGTPTGERWRESAQAEGWVGHAVAEVLNLNVSDGAAKQKVKALLSMWLSQGLLVKSTEKDDGRRSRPIIEVGRWAEVA
jgi:hypothetical protein